MYLYLLSVLSQVNFLLQAEQMYIQQAEEQYYWSCSDSLQLLLHLKQEVN